MAWLLGLVDTTLNFYREMELAMSRLMFALAMVLLACAPRMAKAGVTGNFVVCDVCVQDSDFAQAARVWYGTKTGNLQVTVGNPSTGVLYTMWVAPGRGAPLLEEKSDKTRVFDKAVVASVLDKNIVRADQLSLAATGSGASVSGEFENSQWEPSFNAIVNAHQNSVLFYVTDSMVDRYGDDLMSFSAAQGSVAVSNVILVEEEAVNGTYLSSTESLVGAIQNALDSYYGHGILVTVVFRNGDVATYQLNILDPNATRPVKGTAKDRFGHPLPDAPTSIGRGGAAAAQVSWGGADVTGYGMGSGSSEVWEVCSFVGGVLQGCYPTTERQG